MTELRYPTSARTLAGGAADPDVLAATMATGLPPDGLAAPRMVGTRFARATWRLLDSRILAAAAEILDVDVARPFVDWLATYERLRTAAEATLTDVEQPERTEVLLPPHPVTITDHLSVTIRVDGRQIAEVAFTLEITLTLGEVSAVVRRGAIEEVVADVCSVAPSLALDAWPTPLWHPEPVTVPVRLDVRPPVRIPLVPVPRSPVPLPPVPPTPLPPRTSRLTVSPSGRPAPAGG
jgi:hypothetical protein